jgi:hypothetical protein
MTNIYLCVKNRKLKIKNLPINPAKGGIPDIDRSTKTIVIDTKLFLLKIFNELIVLIFLKSNKKSKEKNKYNKKT